MNIVLGCDKMIYQKQLLCGYSSLIFLLVWFNFQVHVCTGLRLTNMTAPAIQDPRQEMRLHCQFDMGGEELYAVKWYKDDHEFFRFTPASDNEKIMKFPVPGVNVHSAKSQCVRESCDLVLTNLNRPQSSGAYRCEVSSEAPAFRLASQTHNVTVAALPDQPPVLQSVADSYSVGDILNVTCTSGLGDPKPDLKFYINKQPVSPKYVKELPYITINSKEDKNLKLRSSRIQIRLPLDKTMIKHQSSASMEITCISSVFGINESVAPPLATSKNLVIFDQNQIVKNQKLHWPNSLSSKPFPKFLVNLIFIVILKSC